MHTKKHKVLIEASKILTSHKDGTKRYVLDMLRGLLNVAKDKDSKWEFHVYLAMQGNVRIRNIVDIQKIIQEDDPFKNPYKKVALIFGTGYMLKMLSAKIKNQIKIKKKEDYGRKKSYFSIQEFDIIHLTTPQLYQPILNENIANKKSRFVTTVYDLTHIKYPQFQTKENIESVKNGLDEVAKRKSIFVAISKSTVSDLLSEYTSVDKKNVHVVYPAFDSAKFKRVEDHQYISKIMNKYNIFQKPFLLSLCTLEPRKNLINTIKAFLLFKKELPEIDVNLVIAGGKGWKYRELFKDKSLKSSDIIFTGFIDEKDLSAVYTAAIALSYVSFYEGFGLPLLEAMSCGTPVIYGNNSSMPEVAGGAGLPADPYNIDDIKEKFKKIVTNEKLREELSAKALANSKNYSMGLFNKNIIDVYEKILFADS